MSKIRIENVVASASLGTTLDLTAIANALDTAEYDPNQFPGLIYRLKEPKTAILLFRSGKAVCTGGRSWKQLDDSITKVAAIIRKSGQNVPAHPKFQIQNIVATSSLESELNLSLVAVTLGLDRVEYEPEQFPGLVCRMESPRVVMLLFSSGKVVCTGARRPSDLQVAMNAMSTELEQSGLLTRSQHQSASATDRKVQRSPKVEAVASRPRSQPFAVDHPRSNPSEVTA